MAPAGIGADLEGLHAVEAAMEAGRLTDLLVESGRASNPEIADLLARAKTAGVAIKVVDDVRPFAVTAVPQGLVGKARPLKTYTLEDLVEPSPCLLVILDHLEDPHNVGAIARSARAAGVTGLVVPTRRAAPIGPTAFKAAVGALEHLRVSVQSSTADAVQRLKRLGVWTVGLTAGTGERLFGLAPPHRTRRHRGRGGRRWFGQAGRRAGGCSCPHPDGNRFREPQRLGRDRPGRLRGSARAIDTVR